jgi:hypothetical protein
MKDRNRGMRTGWAVVLLVITALATALAGCGGGLPPAAEEAVLYTFDPIDEPRIDSVKRAEPLVEDVEAGAQEVWCVNLTFLCWTPPYSFVEHTTCADSRLVRLIDGEWRVTVVVTEQDRADWEARGCELMPNHVDMPG